MSDITILAVDPALRHGATCVISGDPHADAEPPYGWKVWDIQHHRLPTTEPFVLQFPDGRCFLLWQRRILTQLTQHRPHAVVVEGIGGVDYSPYKSLRASHVLAVVRGIIEMLCYDMKIPYFAPQAGKIKASLGVTLSGKPNATAKKKATMAALANLGLYHGKDEDEADAMMVAYYAMQAIRAGEIEL